MDILVTFDEGAKVSLFKYANMICQLESLLKLKVDLVEEGTLLPFAKETARNDKILIDDPRLLKIEVDWNISYRPTLHLVRRSHPSWVYGLKQSLHNGVNLVSQSHPKQTNTSAKNVEVFCYITESFLSSQ